MATLQEALSAALEKKAGDQAVDLSGFGPKAACQPTMARGSTLTMPVCQRRDRSPVGWPVIATPYGPTPSRCPTPSLPRTSDAVAAAAGIVVPPGYATTEGYASDYDPWTHQSFRAVLRYGQEWLPVDRIVREIAFRPDSTYAYALVDRLGGRVRIWVSGWDGQHGFGWPAKGVLLYDSMYDPPAYSIPQAWLPQPFQIRFPLTAPFTVPAGQGLQVEIQLDGVPDPVWGNRATYWLDVAGGGGTVADMWLDTEPPYMGCAGFASETRTWMVDNRMTLWAQDSTKPNAPAVIILSPTPLLGPECLDVNLTGATMITTTTDGGGQVTLTVPFPLTPVEFAWQTLIFDPAKTDPMQMLGSGHFVRFNPSGIAAGLLWDKNPESGAPSFTLPGTVWVTELS